MKIPAFFKGEYDLLSPENTEKLSDHANVPQEVLDYLEEQDRSPKEFLMVKLGKEHSFVDNGERFYLLPNCEADVSSVIFVDEAVGVKRTGIFGVGCSGLSIYCYQIDKDSPVSFVTYCDGDDPFMIILEQ